MIPIIVRTRNRPQLLDLTLSSLIMSGITPDIIIDDHSDNRECLRYLSGHKIEFCHKWPSDDLWKLYGVHLPTRWSGFTTANVIKNDEQMGEQRSLFQAIKLSFEKFDTDCVVVLEDDIIVCAGWLGNLKSAISEYPNYGVISGFLWSRWGGTKTGVWEEPITAQMLLVSRKLYQPNVVPNPKAIYGDEALRKKCVESGLDVIQLRSQCQHIGHFSTVHNHKNWIHSEDHDKSLLCIPKPSMAQVTGNKQVFGKCRRKLNNYRRKQ